MMRDQGPISAHPNADGDELKWWYLIASVRGLGPAFI